MHTVLAIQCTDLERRTSYAEGIGTGEEANGSRVDIP